MYRIVYSTQIAADVWRISHSEVCDLTAKYDVIIGEFPPEAFEYFRCATLVINTTQFPSIKFT